MCYKFPGPRCSNHALKNLKRAKINYDKALNELLVQQLNRETKEYQVALDGFKESQSKLLEAHDEYLETPHGQAYLKKLEKDMRERGNGIALEEVIAKRVQAKERYNLKKELYKESLRKSAENLRNEDEAQRHLEAANNAEKRAQESFERSDTDGFLSQWASGFAAQLEREKARIARDGGKAEFVALFDKEGNLVPAKFVNTKFGPAWGILSEPENPHSPFTSWVSESKAISEKKRAEALLKKGYRIGIVRVPAFAKLSAIDGARGLGGAASVFVEACRKDHGYSADAEIIDNGLPSES